MTEEGTKMNVLPKTAASPWLSTLPNQINRPPALTSQQQEALKWTAFLAMVVDHAGKVFSSSDMFHLVGRLALPVFCFLVAYNLAVRNTSPRRYLLPLLVTGVVTQPIYAALWGEHLAHPAALQGGAQLNILFTLLLGVVGVGLAKRSSLLLAAVLVGAAGLVCEYGVFGPWLVLAWYVYLKNPSVTTFAAVAMTAYLCNKDAAAWLAAAFCLVPLVWKLAVPGRAPRYAFYLAYPLHLLLLLTLRTTETLHM